MAGFRSRWYPRLLVAALGVAFVVAVLSGSGSETASGRLGGDFPSFYAAGQLVVSDPADLYDPATQAGAQRELFGSEDGGFLYFAYPPHAALWYWPLSELAYRLAYVVHTALMVGALVLAVHLLRPLVPVLDRRFEHAVIASVFFYPMLRGVLSGQNTALSLLLLAAAVRALERERDWLAGLALAALLYKPQFAVPMIGLSLLIRRWRVVAAAVAGGAGLYLVGAALQGWGWVGPWWEQVRWFTTEDAEVNAANAVSFLGVAEAIWGVGEGVAVVLGYTLAAATTAFLAWLWVRRPLVPLAERMAITICGMILLSPHAMYYDAGLLVVSGAVLAGEWARRRAALAVLFGASYLQALAPPLEVAPTFGVVLVTFAWCAARWSVAPSTLWSSSGRDRLADR